jgi:hypothetical protein
MAFIVNAYILIFWLINSTDYVTGIINGRGDSLRWPRDTLYPLNWALTSPTSGGRSVGIVRFADWNHGVYYYYYYYYYY